MPSMGALQPVTEDALGLSSTAALGRLKPGLHWTGAESLAGNHSPATPPTHLPPCYPRGGAGLVGLGGPGPGVMGHLLCVCVWGGGGGGNTGRTKSA